VRADRAKLRQVLLNLLTNARDAMSSPGGVRVRLRAEGQNHACIQIEDTGCGIPQEGLAEIFLPFNSCSGSGAGLGLAIAKRIVDTAGGTIRVRSQVGKGSCFDVVLPLAEIGVGHSGPA
jgi:signal transduction histidine kinase